MSSNPITESSTTRNIVPSHATPMRGMANISKGVVGPSAPNARMMNIGNPKRRAAHAYGAINRLRILASLHCVYLPQSSLIRLMCLWPHEPPKQEHDYTGDSEKSTFRDLAPIYVHDRKRGCQP